MGSPTPLPGRRLAIGIISAVLHTRTEVSLNLQMLDLANLLLIA